MGLELGVGVGVRIRVWVGVDRSGLASGSGLRLGLGPLAVVGGDPPRRAHMLRRRAVPTDLVRG